LRYGIPEYRLPNSIVDNEIGYVQDLGVEIKLNSPINKLEDLFSNSYEAVYLATGAGSGQKMGIPGEDNAGVMEALSFLRRANSGEKIELGQKVGWLAVATRLWMPPGLPTSRG